MRYAPVISLIAFAAFAAPPCETRVAKMKAALNKLPDQPPAVEFAIDSLPVGPTKRAISEVGSVLVVQHDFPLVLDGQNLGEDEDAAIKQFLNRIKNSKILYVAVNPDVSWLRVRHVFAALPANLELRLIVTSKPAKPKSEKDVAALINGIIKASGNCDGVMIAIGDSTTHGQTHSWHYLKPELANAVEACECENVAVESLTGVVSKLGSDQLSYGWLELTRFDFSGSATMSDVAKQLR